MNILSVIFFDPWLIYLTVSAAKISKFLTVSHLTGIH